MRQLLDGIGAGIAGMDIGITADDDFIFLLQFFHILKKMNAYVKLNFLNFLIIRNQTS